jgi:hypothetical protein
MDGASVVDVGAYSFPTDLADWIVLYAVGARDKLQRQEWVTLYQRVEQRAFAALEAVGPPYWARMSRA